MNFQDLNRVCLKDSYPLSQIDQLVDATSGYEMLIFMDAFSGYNQIRMHSDDDVHTTFYVDSDIFCSHFMPFSLVNVGATYQRMVSKLFKGVLGRNMEAYVDEMLIKPTKSKGSYC